MAIVRLTDIVATMKDKWTYGDKFFGYTEEFNDNHNTQYPSLLITPPDSVYPEVTPRNGWEEYSFEVYFSDLYNRTAQANESIEQRWDNLQDLANEWLDMFLKSYMGTQAHKTTISYLMDGSLAIERRKEVANDQLLQLKMNFGFRIFSKCFAPVSNYPNQISGLTSWLRADSNATFSIPTKKVSIIGDGSGNGNGVRQTVASGQPLRYSYGGGTLDKTMFTFDNNILDSKNNFTTSLSNEQFSVFEVSKINAVSNAVFGYFSLLSEEFAVDGDFGSIINWTTSASTNGSYWVIDTANNKATVTTNTGNGANAIIKNTGSTLVVATGEVYKVTYEIKDYVSGTVRARAGTGAGTANNNDGIYTEYITGTANASNLNFECSWSMGFQGSIANVSIKKVGGASIEMGTNAAGNYEVSVSDGTTTLLEKTATVDTGKFHIGVLRKYSYSIQFNYYDSLSQATSSDTNAAFDAATSFEQDKFRLGCTKGSNGLVPPSLTNVRYLKGDFQEVIIYDRKLTDDETAKVVDYLNKKYRIY